MSDCTSCVDDFANAGCDFLNPNSIDNVSRTIEIGGDYAYILKGYNLQPGQHAIVELVSGYGDGQMFVPYIVNNKRMELNTETTLLVLKNTGRYRVVVVDDAGNAVNPGLLMPTICAERAESSCGCSEGTEIPDPPCPPVTILLDASAQKKIIATVTGGPGTIKLMPGSIEMFGSGPFDFVGLMPDTAYVASFVSDCGSKASASAQTLPAPVVPVYCPSLRFEACGCDEVGFGYRNNALRDPAATIQVTACDGETVMWIYPAEGVTGAVRHEIPYSEEDGVVLGYMANNSDCAPPVSLETVANVYNTVAAPVINNAFAPTTNVAAPSVVLPAPHLVAAEWMSEAAALKLTQSDGSVITTQPIPACDN